MAFESSSHALLEGFLVMGGYSGGDFGLSGADGVPSSPLVVTEVIREGSPTRGLLLFLLLDYFASPFFLLLLSSPSIIATRTRFDLCGHGYL